MRYATRFTLALGLVGAVAVAGAATAENHEGSEPGKPDLGNPKPVTSSKTLSTDEGLVSIQKDWGVITAVSDSSVTFERLDGASVDFSVTEDTTIRKNGEEVALSELAVGDKVHTIKATREGEVIRSGVMSRDEDFEPRRGKRGRGHRRGGPRGPGGPSEDAEFSSSAARLPDFANA